MGLQAAGGLQDDGNEGKWQSTGPRWSWAKAIWEIPAETQGARP